MRELTEAEVALISGGSPESREAGYRAGYAVGKYLSYAGLIFGLGGMVAGAMS